MTSDHINRGLSARELRSLGEKYLFTSRYGAFDTGDEPPVIVKASGPTSATKTVGNIST